AISHNPSGTIQLHAPRPMPTSTTPHHIGHGLSRRQQAAPNIQHHLLEEIPQLVDTYRSTIRNMTKKANKSPEWHDFKLRRMPRKDVKCAQIR
ncbi:hypothetical protein ACFWB2_44115, partial [Streptomyces virginiae]|uniref:hypothetical protein n=1 Tax=Streptomyces virginiae TaxID=1961 RepID=UPI00369A8256